MILLNARGGLSPLDISGASAILFSMKQMTDDLYPSVREYVTRPSVAYRYDAYFKDSALFRLDSRLLERHITVRGPLIDLGCGTGRHLVHFGKKGFPVFGIDLSKHMLTCCGRKLKKEGLNASLVCGNLLKLPFRDNSFSYALCMFSTIGLVSGKTNRAVFLREVHRVLKPGGLFFVHVHNRLFNAFDSWGRRWLLRTYFSSPFKGIETGDKIIDYYRGIRDMYLHVFSLGEIKRALRRARLTVAKVYFINEPRDAELEGRFFRSWRSNGFIVVAKKRKR
jgi:ubiquinone/menaquinone biosynthesis C-methylase UbiE